MKKILVLEGSPRAKGNTALVTDWVLAGLGERGVRVERVRAADKEIAGCCECFSCISSKKKPGCSQDDDLTGSRR